ncbi:hypothetical protein SH2C18_34630 [Clostridium sediminicola]|uniref:hypothetical protein n=1 Tax=Clostridium sediminicola TaxID=3114879 RepID=UPI0031F1E501
MKYTYSDLVEDLELGQEIEFKYSGDRYSISANISGWYLTKYGEVEYQSFKDIDDLLQNARINSMSLKDIWNETTF